MFSDVHDWLYLWRLEIPENMSEDSDCPSNLAHISTALLLNRLVSFLHWHIFLFHFSVISSRIVATHYKIFKSWHGLPMTKISKYDLNDNYRCLFNFMINDNATRIEPTVYALIIRGCFHPVYKMLLLYAAVTCPAVCRSLSSLTLTIHAVSMNTESLLAANTWKARNTMYMGIMQSDKVRIFANNRLLSGALFLESESNLILQWCSESHQIHVKHPVYNCLVT